MLDTEKDFIVESDDVAAVNEFLTAHLDGENRADTATDLLEVLKNFKKSVSRNEVKF